MRAATQLSTNRLFAFLAMIGLLTSLLMAFSAVQAPAAHADGPGQIVGCNDGIQACSVVTNGWGATGSNSQGGGGLPTGGPTGNGNFMSFAGVCTYGSTHIVSPGTFSENPAGVYSYPTPPNTNVTAICMISGPEQDVIQKAKPPTVGYVPKPQATTCPPIMIGGEWAPAVGAYSYSNSGWVQKTYAGIKEWVSTWGYSCVYPGKKVSDLIPVKQVGGAGYCVVSGILHLYSSDSASVINGGDAGSWGDGTLEKISPTYYPDPKFNPSKAAETCKDSLTYKWNGLPLPSDNGVPKYDFYRLSTKAQVRYCKQYTPPAWMQAPVYYKCSDPITQYLHVRFTYTCLSSGTVYSNSVKQSDDYYFQPSHCAGNNWSCKVGPTKIAGQTDKVQVMRNGKSTPVNFGKLAVNNVDRVTNQKRYTSVDNGSTPYLRSADVNSVNQYFQMLTSDSKPFGNGFFNNWQSINSYGNNGNLLFTWASDPTTTWSMTSKYMFDGYFHVYAQSTLGSGTHPVTEPQTSVACQGPQDLSKSPKVTVVRSVNTNQ